MGLFLELFLGLMILASLATLFIIWYIYRRPIISVAVITGNEPKVLNLMPMFTNGHANFLEYNLKTGKDGRKLAYLYPTDNKFAPDNRDQPPIEVQKMVLKPGQRISFAVGELSDHSEFVIYNVDNLNKLPEHIKNTELGKSLANLAIINKFKADADAIDYWKKRTKTLLIKSEYDFVNIFKKDAEEWIKDSEKKLPGEQISQAKTR